MNVVATINRQDDIEMSINITMTVGQWRKLREKLGTDYPGWALSPLIREVLDKSLSQVSASHRESNDH